MEILLIFCFYKFEDVVDGGVAGGFDAELFCKGDDGAVERVNFGFLFREEVLEGR